MTLLNERKPSNTQCRLKNTFLIFFVARKRPSGASRISVLAPPFDVSIISMLLPMDAG